MTPQARMKKVIRAEASRSSSDFEDISHRGTTKRAKVEFGDFRKTTKGEYEDKSIQDEISFLQVEATYVSKGDDIVYDEVTYSVEYFSLVMKGIYSIFATKKKRTGSKR